MATFRQTTSRADDPQLHTHAVISAKVQTDDGRWLALDARYLKRHQRMLGGLYQSVLRAELTHRYGVGVGADRQRPGRDRRHAPASCSRCSRSGPARSTPRWRPRSTSSVAARVGTRRRWERAALCREASADTRAHKTGNGVADLRTRWAAEAAELGWTAEPARRRHRRRRTAHRRAGADGHRRGGHRPALGVGFDVDPGRRAASDLRPPAARVRDVGTPVGRRPRTRPATR